MKKDRLVSAFVILFIYPNVIGVFKMKKLKLIFTTLFLTGLTMFSLSTVVFASELDNKPINYYIDEELIDTFIDISELSDATKSNTYEKLTLVSTTRFNYGSGGTVNPYNFGELPEFGRAIRSSFCWSPSFFSTQNINIGFGIGPVNISFSKPSVFASNCTNVPASLSSRYTRIYNYNDVTVKKYKVDVYDRYSGKYIKSYYTSDSTINGFKYVPQAA